MADPDRDAVAIVLAAGHGKRMRSDLPKVLHRAAGRPLLTHVISALEAATSIRGCVVVTSGRTEIQQALGDHRGAGPISFVVQDPALGTADAVRVALESEGTSGGQGLVLVTAGDTPLVRAETFEALLAEHSARRATATLLTAHVSDPTGYGRVLRDAGGAVEGVVEERDASDEQRAIDEINGGTYVFDVVRLSEALGKVDAANAQGEYLLTDVIGVLRAAGDPIASVVSDETEVAGVNSRSQLAEVSQVLRKRACDLWLERGVTIVDPSVTYIDSSVTIGRDAVVHPFTFLEGETHVGEGASIGPQARLVDSDVGEGAVVSFAVVVGSSIGPEASVGPFASLRPGTRLERNAKVGTFVETKSTTLGEGSKAPHLSYLGDAAIGRRVNVGAGTITCNYDGESKHETVIEDDVFIGSDTMLVAPARIGEGASTGAGAVVRGDVPAGALAVGVPARILDGKGKGRKRKTEGRARD